MKKYILLLPLILFACSGLNPLPKKSGKGAYIITPAGYYFVQSEQDFQKAKRDCRKRFSGRFHDNDHCLNELRWQRNYGELRFLGEEKPKPIFQN